MITERVTDKNTLLLEARYTCSLCKMPIDLTSQTPVLIEEFPPVWAIETKCNCSIGHIHLSLNQSELREDIAVAIQDFKDNYEDAGCRCHCGNHPCGFCTHPANPENLKVKRHDYLYT